MVCNGNNKTETLEKVDDSRFAVDEKTRTIQHHTVGKFHVAVYLRGFYIN